MPAKSCLRAALFAPLDMGSGRCKLVAHLSTAGLGGGSWKSGYGMDPSHGKETVMKKTMVLLALAALLVAAASCSKTPKEETSSTTETSQQTAQSTSSAPVARGEAATVHTSFHVEAVDA